MWRLKKIYSTNIVSFRELEMSIAPGVATMIFGQNLDNENQKCNGSGKSSLIEAVAFGITGDTLRKVKVEDIINDKADNASVQLMFENDYDGLVFIIDRSVSRKEPQKVECHLMLNGEEVHTERTVQPSVTDYNKYILNELGITKDELYSSFILCKNHYQSFLDASDKNKKEIINRFSNGLLVDGSIEHLAADMVPVQQRKSEAELEVTKIRGKIEAISDELNNADAQKEEAVRSREAKIEEYNGKIAAKRAEIRSLNEQVEKAKTRRNAIRKFDERMQDLENSDKSFEDSYKSMSDELAALSMPPVKDYVSRSKEYVEEIGRIKANVNSWKKKLSENHSELAVLEDEVSRLTEEVAKSKADCEAAESSDKASIAEIQLVIEKLKGEREKLRDDSRGEQAKLTGLEKRLHQIEVTLNGSIKCPNCGHEFLYGKDDDVKAIKTEKAQVEKDIDQSEEIIKDIESKMSGKAAEIIAKEEERSGITKRIDMRYNGYLELSNKLTSASVRLDQFKSSLSRISSSIEKGDMDIDALNGKIQNLSTLMFDEVYGIIDGKMSQAKQYIDDCRSKIKFAEGQISQYESAIEEVRTQKTEDIAIRLEASKRQYEKELELASADFEAVSARYDELAAQMDLFVEFKSHLANQKIDAIAAVTNEFLELIGSDIRLQLEGFRRLKSGKLRDKITVKILRNGMDCGAFEKFSGGERARVYLANILAMQKITNSNCDEGKGLDLLIEDEILDCSDESGMMSFCDALNELGATSMLVTQVPVSESYPYRLLVTKHNGESKISV